MMNEYVELKQQCMKIAKQFKQEADELEMQAYNLTESAQYIEMIVDIENLTAMQNLVKIHGEVTEGDEE